VEREQKFNASWIAREIKTPEFTLSLDELQKN